MKKIITAARNLQLQVQVSFIKDSLFRKKNRNELNNKNKIAITNMRNKSDAKIGEKFYSNSEIH